MVPLLQEMMRHCNAAIFRQFIVRIDFNMHNVLTQMIMQSLKVGFVAIDCFCPN